MPLITFDDGDYADYEGMEYLSKRQEGWHFRRKTILPLEQAHITRVLPAQYEHGGIRSLHGIIRARNSPEMKEETHERMRKR